jgi:hypothetical protein
MNLNIGEAITYSYQSGAGLKSYMELRRYDESKYQIQSCETDGLAALTSQQIGRLMNGFIKVCSSENLTPCQSDAVNLGFLMETHGKGVLWARAGN